jgi:outer membrane protein assembly factor BamB
MLKRRWRLLLFLPPVVLVAVLAVSRSANDDSSGPHYPTPFLDQRPAPLVTQPFWELPRPTRRPVPLPFGRGWRGDGTGHYPEATPPLHWSESRNVAWAVPLPGPGNGTPVVVGDRLFVTAEPDSLVAFNTATGERLWTASVSPLDGLEGEEKEQARRVIADAAGLDAQIRSAEAELTTLKREQRKEGHASEIETQMEAVKASITSMQERISQASQYLGAGEGSYVGDAAQTPVTDGESVFVAFGDFTVAAFDLEGHRRWARFLPHGAPHLHDAHPDRTDRMGIGASLLLAADRLIVPMTALYALNPDTGATDWMLPDYNDWGTPARVTLGQTDFLALPDGRVVRAEDGRLVADLYDGTHSNYVGPTVDGRILTLSPLGDRTQAGVATIPGKRLLALELPDDEATAFEPRLLWRRIIPGGELRGGTVTSDGQLFAVDTDLTLHVFDLTTGDVLHERALPAHGDAAPSLAVAGGHVFIPLDSGEVVVINAVPPYDQVADNVLGGLGHTLRASPVFDGRRIYLRTATMLYCFEEQGER